MRRTVQAGRTASLAALLAPACVGTPAPTLADTLGRKRRTAATVQKLQSEKLNKFITRWSEKP